MLSELATAVECFRAEINAWTAGTLRSSSPWRQEPLSFGKTGSGKPVAELKCRKNLGCERNSPPGCVVLLHSPVPTEIPFRRPLPEHRTAQRTVIVQAGRHCLVGRPVGQPAQVWTASWRRRFLVRKGVDCGPLKPAACRADVRIVTLAWQAAASGPRLMGTVNPTRSEMLSPPVGLARVPWHAPCQDANSAYRAAEGSGSCTHDAPVQRVAQTRDVGGGAARYGAEFLQQQRPAERRRRKVVTLDPPLRESRICSASEP